MPKDEIDKILANHQDWLKGGLFGKASLIGRDLSEIFLPEVNLNEADLSEANLRGANLVEANLRGANLRDTDLRWTVLDGVDLTGADLRGANLREADLREALLDEADLREADLTGVNLSRASLVRANLDEATLPHFQIVPESGSFTAYKMTDKGVIKIQIPAKAKRTSNLIGRKCRAEYVKVLSGVGLGGCSPSSDLRCVYQKGAIVYADRYDDDIRVEYTGGIHFFMTHREALSWGV